MHFSSIRIKIDITVFIALAYAYLDKALPGSWSIEGGILRKGTIVIQEENGLVDELGSLLDAKITIFPGDTRTATNVVAADGARAVRGGGRQRKGRRSREGRRVQRSGPGPRRSLPGSLSAHTGLRGEPRSACSSWASHGLRS